MFGYAPNPLCLRENLCFTWFTTMLLIMLFNIMLPFVNSTNVFVI